ncbi:hypothetical protein [Nostoc sp.]|uniref:hypothetical protein n=1 Tax=Nostoc sp. TaxID=1180 RepID=UPI002FFAFA45
MNLEEKMLAKWRFLPADKQEEVLDFVEFLYSKNSANKISSEEGLYQIRARILDSGKNFLDENQIRKQSVSQENGLHDKEE